MKQKVREAPKRKIHLLVDALTLEAAIQTAERKKYKARLRLLYALKENPDLPVRDVADWIDGEEFAKCTRSDAANNKNKLVGRINFVKNKLISGE